MTIEQDLERAFLAERKSVYSSSVQVMSSVDERPEMESSSTSGDRMDEQPGITRAKTIHAPLTLSGGEHEDNAKIWCGLAVKVHCDHVQPKIVVHYGLMIVLEAKRRKLFLLSTDKTLVQFSNSSSGVLPPQHKSSAKLATTPS